MWIRVGLASARARCHRRFLQGTKCLQGEI